MNQGKVSLVGAGCGRMDLITLRGLRLLRACDVVIYDDLIDEALLSEAPERAERLYMGKRKDRHSAPQAEISGMLIKKAQEGKAVVRLKGGDPFVFGRGGEEILALQAAGIPCEVVPGISSCIAIPQAAGIPVTHRGVSRSFHVITGHMADQAGLSERMETLAALSGTLVFLMGLSHLEDIASGLMAAGKAPETPAAVISGGSAAHPACVRGTLSDIARKTRDAAVKTPAIILIGETAGMNLPVSIKKPLSGVTVGTTGTDSLTEKLRALLEAQGARVLPAERSVVDVLPFSLQQPDGKPRWLVFTSANGVRLFFDTMKKARVDSRAFSSCRFAVIGKPTGKALESHGFYADLCPETFTSETLGKALVKAVKPGEEVVLLRAKKAAAILPELLNAAQIPVRDVPVYDLHTDSQTSERAREILEALDYLTFSSAGGVELFLEAHGTLPEKAVCVCIGAMTAKALEKRTRKPFLIAKSTTAEGLVETILAHQKEV